MCVNIYFTLLRSSREITFLEVHGKERERAPSSFRYTYDYASHKMLSGNKIKGKYTHKATLAEGMELSLCTLCECVLCAHYCDSEIFCRR